MVEVLGVPPSLVQTSVSQEMHFRLEVWILVGANRFSCRASTPSISGRFNPAFIMPAVSHE